MNGDGGTCLRPRSTWNTFHCHINETLVEQSIDALASSALYASGYNYLLIDDCWTECLDLNKEDGSCNKAGPRDANGRIIPSATKFPSGMPHLTALAHQVHRTSRHVTLCRMHLHYVNVEYA